MFSVPWVGFSLAVGCLLVWFLIGSLLCLGLCLVGPKPFFAVSLVVFLLVAFGCFLVCL